MWNTLLKSEGRLLLSFLEKLNFNNSIINKKIKCLNFSQQDNKKHSLISTIVSIAKLVLI